MKKMIVGLSLICVVISQSLLPLYAVGIPVPSVAPIADVDRTILPDNFPVYTNGRTIISHPLVHYTIKFLPTNNDYKSDPGCYVGCYSANEDNSIYSPAEGVYLIGQIRVAGSYDSKTCKPIGFENKDIRKVKKFITLCSASFAPCKGDHCWAGGNTGGWFTS